MFDAARWGRSSWRLALLPTLLLVPRPLSAACDPCTPAIPAPAALWAKLEPLDPPGLPLPVLRDSTTYTGAAGQFPDSGLPLFTSIDIETGYAFVAYSSGFEIWNLAAPPAIVRVGLVNGWRGNFMRWPGQSENRWLIWDLDAPEGNGDLLATAGYVGIGIWDIRVKSNPLQAYQDGMSATNDIVKAANSVWTATLGDGRSYAFLASSTNSTGLFVYDMTRALDYLPGGCAEDASVAIGCPGVYKGRVGTSIAYWVDGIQVGGRTFIAFGSALASGNAQIWDVTTPAAPTLVVNFLGGSWPHAGAFWTSGAATYLGMRTAFGPAQARIYDVTACVDGDGCAANEIQQTWAANLADFAAHYFVTFSRSGTTPFLYFGSDNKNSGGLQREYLYDVTDPAAPLEVSPKTTAVLGGDTVDYWGYYYAGNASGFNQVMPRVGKFDGLNLYRAAWTLFDIHRYKPPPPPPLFTDGFESGDTGAWTPAP